MHKAQLEGIAATVADLQLRCGHLPRASGFGYALNYATPMIERLTSTIERML